MRQRKAMQIRAIFAVCTWGILAACVQSSPPAASDAGASAAVVRAAVAPPTPPPLDPRPHGDPEIERTCAAICEQSQQLKCSHASDCMVNCLAMGTVTPCTPEMKTFYKCLLKQGIKNWECDEDGVAAIRRGFCDKEQETVVLCMDKKVKP
jgi:hypothetical protein